MVHDESGGAAPGSADPGTAGQPTASPSPPPSSSSSPNQPSPAWAIPAPAKVEIAPGLVLASTGRRVVAWMIDGFITSFVAYMLWTLFLIVTGVSAITDFSAVVLGVTITAVSFVYFVGGWRTTAQATVGMRLLKLQIGNAFDGRKLTLDQGTRRWIALGFPLSLFAALPVIGSVAALADVVLEIVLLVTTVRSPTKQGLHDRYANSAMVEPTGAGLGALAGCLLALVIVVFISTVGIVALLFLGGQISTILSATGSPAP